MMKKMKQNIMLDRIITVTADIDENKNCVWGYDTNVGSIQEVRNRILKILREYGWEDYK